MLRKRYQFIGLVIAIVVSTAVAFGSAAKGDESLAKFLDGNKRFMSGGLATKDIGDARRQELLKGQHPAAIVVTCSDSRVAPEIIFDQGLGDVFVIRVAGNVLDPVAMGSIEYAAEHLHAPLLVLMGHEKCGAVAAAIESKGVAEGNIGMIIKKILPSVRRAAAKGGSDEERLTNTIKENVHFSQRYLLKRSPVISHLVKAGELKIVTALYHLGSGEVEILK